MEKTAERKQNLSVGSAAKAIRTDALKRIFKIIFKDYSVFMVLVFISIFINAFAYVKGILFLKSLIDDYISKLVLMENPNFTPLAKAILKVAMWYAAGAFSGYIYQRLMVNVCQGTLLKLRNELFEHMQLLPVKYFDTHSFGDIMSVYTNDIDALRQFIGQSFPTVVQAVFNIGAALVSMIVLNVPLTIFSVIFIAIILIVSNKIAKSSGEYFVKQQREMGDLNGYIEEMMNGEKIVKAFNYEEKTIAQFEEKNIALCKSAYKANAMANILMPTVAQLGNLDFVIVAVIGAVFAVSGKFGLTVGTLVAFLTLNKSFNRPFSEISNQINAVVMASAGAERIFNIIDEKQEVDEGYVQLVNVEEDDSGNFTESKSRTGIWAWKHYHKEDGTTTYKKLSGNIVMEGVCFSYDGKTQVLKNVELFANKGQKLAFVGSTGAGKTTITNLINRFYDIQDGKIRYDGININKIKKSDLRRSLGIVFQDTHLFTGTVMDNIRYGRLDATDDECIAAAKLSNAHDFIERLSNGYDTILSNDGSALSQGQRQLIAIARAAVADPPVLILDEATSSIDTRTERLVQNGMDALMKGRTTFAIAHRLSTVRNSDCIMVLEHGKIIERGTHEQLLEKHGKYYELYIGKK